MSKRFEGFIQFVKDAETVYKKGHYGDDNFVVVERDPDDPGGVTKWGLDARTHGPGVEHLTWPEAKQVYLDWYWNGKTKNTKWDSCGAMPPKVGEILFDTRINMGFSPAKRILLAANGDPSLMIKLRDERYRAIVKARPTSLKYLEGWLNRNNNLRRRLVVK